MAVEPDTLCASPSLTCSWMTRAMPKKVDLQHYYRRDTFQAFLQHDMPVVSITCELDVTQLWALRRHHGLRFFPLLALAIDRSINALTEFRHRIIAGELYEFAAVHPSFTVLRGDNSLTFCDAQHLADPAAFYRQVEGLGAQVRQQANQDMRDKHERYFVTNLPWLRFTSISHPYIARYASIPIVSIGKCTPVGGQMLLPVAVQGHHSLVDGFHLAEFYRLLQAQLDAADALLAGVLAPA